jgi:general secretion pathway protein C
VKIERDRLTIENAKSGKLEYLKLAAYDSKRAVSKQAMEAPGRDKEFQVERSLVDQTLRNLQKFLNDARAVPVTGPGGAVTGFKLEWIAPGSLYEKLGLKEGDTLSEVNGIKLDGIPKAVEIFQQFKNSSMIRLNIDRNGKPLDLTYLVR